MEVKISQEEIKKSILNSITEKEKNKNSYFLDELKNSTICFSKPAVIEQKQTAVNAYIEMAKSRESITYHYKNYNYLSHCYFVSKNDVALNKALADEIHSHQPGTVAGHLYADDTTAKNFHVDATKTLGMQEYHNINVYYLRTFDVKDYKTYSYGEIEVPFWEVYFNYKNPKGKYKSYHLGYVKETILFNEKDEGSLYLIDLKDTEQKFVSQLDLPSAKSNRKIKKIILTLLIIFGIAAFLIYFAIMEGFLNI